MTGGEETLAEVVGFFRFGTSMTNLEQYAIALDVSGNERGVGILIGHNEGLL